MMKYFILLLTFTISLNPLQSQVVKACGTVISEADMQRFYNRDKSHISEFQLKGTNSIVYIPITYHLIANDNGYGAFSSQETFELHCSLNEDFEDAQVIFYIHDIVYHNSTYYYTMADASAGNSMFLNENRSNTCNIFIVEEANAGTTSVCGYSYLASYGPIINGNGIVLAKSCVGSNSSTLTHEMGHYLNLPHTFYRWEGKDYYLDPLDQTQWERVDGSNCTTTGDGFCDTPPDYISDRWNCNGSQTFTDAVGQSFDVDEKNYMSYSSDNCQEYFKPDQQAEVNAAPANYRTSLLALTPPNFTSVAIPNTFTPANNQNFLSTSFDLSWEAIPNADYYLLQITTSDFSNLLIDEIVNTNTIFLDNLNLGITYYWRVLAFNYGNVCSSFTDIKNFTTSSSFTSAVAIQNISCVFEEDGSIDLTSTESNVTYELFEFDSTSLDYVLIATTSSNSFDNLAANQYQLIATNSLDDKSYTYFSITIPTEIELSLNISSSNIYSSVTGGTPPYSYIWSNGSNNIYNTNPTEGENTLYVSDANDCLKSTSIVYEPIHVPNGIQNIESLNWDLSIYPNPLKGSSLSISIESKINAIAKLELYSIDGKLLLKETNRIQNGDNHFQIDLSSFSKGAYYIKTTIGKETSNRKLII